MKKFIAVDFYDLIWQQTERIFSLDDMDALFRKYAEHGIDAVLWRLSVCGKLLYHTRTPDRCAVRGEPGSLQHRAFEVMQQYDPAEAAVTMGRKYGIEVYFWLTVFDEAGYSVLSEYESSISLAHPEYSWRAKDGSGYYRGVLSYVYPEVVEFKLRQIREIASYGGAGIYLCNRSHSRSPVIRKAMEEARMAKEDVNVWCREHTQLLVSEFKRCRGQYGYDPIALESYKGDLEDVVSWQRHRGSYFTSFMEKAREAAQPGKLFFGLRYGANLGPYIYGDHFFDWERFSDGSTVDALAYDLQPPDYDKPEDFPEFYRTTGGAKLLWMSLSRNDPERLIEAYRPSIERWRPFMDGIILFEAYHMTFNQAYWEFIRDF